jgi:hypothetical protein
MNFQGQYSEEEALATSPKPVETPRGHSALASPSIPPHLLSSPLHDPAHLGVRYVLEGSVRKSGNRIRITAQLIDAKDGTHLWAERYDRAVNDISSCSTKAADPIKHNRRRMMPIAATDS